MNVRNVALSAIAAATLLVAGCNSEPKDPNDEGHINGMDKATAFVLCQKEAKKQLKSPDSAKFPNATDADISKSDDGGQWGVRMHVDSENAFGAMMRSEIACTVQPTDDKSGRVDAVLAQQ